MSYDYGENQGRGNLIGTPESKTPSKGHRRKFDSFLFSVTGSIESANLFGVNDAYVKYNLVYGKDWTLTGGSEEGISQVATKDYEGCIVWNLPFDATFKGSNPHGWPQIVVSLYGSDVLGNHVARGYGTTHLPVSPGSHQRKVSLFLPESSSFIQKISAWLLGRQPEFVDPKVIANGEGKQVVRVQSEGCATIKFHVILKEFQQAGYVS